MEIGLNKSMVEPEEMVLVASLILLAPPAGADGLAVMVPVLSPVLLAPLVGADELVVMLLVSSSADKPDVAEM